VTTPLDDRLAALHGLSPDFGRAELEALQFSRLAETIAHARARSPFYRDRADWPEGPIDGQAALARLPFTTPDDLVRADPPLAAVSAGEIERMVTQPTSGTTGAPKRVGFSAEDREATLDFFHHGMSLFTTARDRVAIAFPADRPGGVGDGLAAALRRLGATPLIVPSEATPEELADFLRREGATMAAGPPVRLLAAARVSRFDGGAPIRLRAVLVSSDHASGALRRGLERGFGADVHDHWGMTETGYGGAVECSAHAGLHVREADLLVEVVDPATGAALPFGEAGEVVVTTLGRRAMPLVRYRTGDRGRLIDAPCACGSRLVRLVGLDGRLDGDVAIDGRRFGMPRLDEILFGVDGVCDFEARLVEGTPPTLVLSVAAVRSRPDTAIVAAVEAAVAADGLLGPLVATGRLRLSVGRAEGTIVPRRGKRRLVREEAPCAASI
jgi:phenylacetate-coenzyme A ligase PaaK-like adenylate-forming protein